MPKEKYDQLSNMIAWEQDELSDDDTVILFQNLVDTGLAWRLQGCYGRMAARLIDAGLVHKKERKVA